MGQNKTSYTDLVLEMRKDSSVDKIETGIWYSGFSAMKAYAEEKGLPLVAVWTNGDVCSYCVKFEKCLLDPAFLAWQKESGCLFWFGCSKDKTEDDKKSGIGYKWCHKDGVTTFPFVSIYLKSDDEVRIEHHSTGNTLDKKSNPPKGAENVVNALKAILDTTALKLKVRENPDWTKQEIADFKKTIKENGGYCPCSAEKTPDTKCMCKWFREATEPGNCHCGLHNKYFA